MIRYLGRDAVLRLNETHGYFQFRDAQGDVSRDFANDAVSAFISSAIESTLVLDKTGKTPAQLAASLADAQAEIARLRGALEVLETDAHFIFSNPPGETSQDVRDVIEWFAGSIRVALEQAK